MRAITRTAIAAALAVTLSLTAGTPGQPPAKAGGQNPAGDLFERLTTHLGPGDKPFAMVVRVKIKAGAERRFEEQARKTAAAARAEKGCIAYDVHRDLENPSEYVFVERWRSVSALREHFQAEHTKAILSLAGEVADGAPQFSLLAPAAVAPERPAR